jgi:mono/diheme cytochrome c family protein
LIRINEEIFRPVTLEQVETEVGRAMKLAASCMILAAAMVATLCAEPALAVDKAAARRGAAIVDQWCRDCHQRKGERRRPEMAPPHDELVNRPGRDRSYYERFMTEDHFPMTIYRLFDQEKHDVVDYLLSLKKEN